MKPRVAFVSTGGTIAAGNLNAQKARILLALALTATLDREEIQSWFDRY